MLTLKGQVVYRIGDIKVRVSLTVDGNIISLYILYGGIYTVDRLSYYYSKKNFS